MNFNIEEVPFSRLGSYFSMLTNDWGPLGKGLYLRIHCGDTVQAFKVDLVKDDQVLEYSVKASPSVLKLAAGGGEVEFVISSQDTVRIRGKHVALRLEMPAERWTWAYQLPDGWAFNYSRYEIQLALEILCGELDVVAPWQKGKGFCWETKHAIVTIAPDANGRFEAAIDEFLTTWVKPERPSFDACLQTVAAEYAEWTEGLPDASEEYKQARDLAAYVNWSATVNPSGKVTRPTMYMSKAGMCNVYNWDNVFNAMAHCSHQPDLAWDQLLVMADHQDKFGKSPTSLNRYNSRTTVTNAPVHGWGLKYMWQKNPDLLTSERMAEAYRYLSGWTEWITSHRIWPGDRLPYHHHGFDSGWDNSSIFDHGVPVVTPDYAAYVILQMEVLADLANALGREEDSRNWTSRAEAMLSALVEDLWKNDKFVGIVRPSGEIVDCESLLICMPIVLGKRLPVDIQRALVNRIKDHMAPHGLATEKLESPNYVEGGYWRGPIWAPSTMIVVSGLMDVGEEELATELMRLFCDMCKQNGFYENFDPVTGKGYFDSAYTWTSSVFMIFAEQLKG
jgi:putative isomerase